MPLDVANLTEADGGAFSKCAPYVETNVKRCGSVTLCDAKPLTVDQLADVYTDGSPNYDYRVMEALLMNDMEIRQCEVVQNGMYEFLMANRVNMSKRMSVSQLSTGLMQIAPFIKAKQYSPINNAYWKAANGGAAGGGQDQSGGAVAAAGGTWTLDVTSTTNVPADIRSFPVGMRIFVEGVSAGGSLTKTAWEIVYVHASLVGGAVQVGLKSQNAGSYLHADKIDTAPVTALVRRGTPNINDFEKWCEEAPTYMNWKHVPFWCETTRHSMCNSSLYNQWRALLLANNPLYKEFGDLDDIERNRQLGQDWQRRFVDMFFWNKPINDKQTLAAYDELDDILIYDNAISGDNADASAANFAGQNLGVDGGKCIGKRANAVGVYEQLAQCDRIIDVQGSKLSLFALFQEMYNIMRVRQGNGQVSNVIDVFTDTVTAEQINTAMIKYYNSKSDNTLRLTKSVDNDVKEAVFGFNYRSYRLFWPNVTMNVVTHFMFDDYITGAQAALSDPDAGRVVWVLDFAGIYPAILDSSRVVHRTGDLKTLGSISADFACVMKVPTQTQTLTSVTYTTIVECPASNLIIENVAGTEPNYTDDGQDYSGTSDYGTTAP